MGGFGRSGYGVAGRRVLIGSGQKSNYFVGGRRDISAGIYGACLELRVGEEGFVSVCCKFPDAELRGAIDGQYVKVTGVISFPPFYNCVCIYNIFAVLV